MGPFPVLRQVNGDEWVVVEEFRRDTRVLGVVVVPVGSTTDGASRPAWSKAIFTRWGRHTAAVVIHDALYRGAARDPYGDPFQCSRKAADRVFREIMERDGVGKIKRNLMYWAVRAGGRSPVLD